LDVCVLDVWTGWPRAVSRRGTSRRNSRLLHVTSL
jgi:hypothetical protein